MGNGGGDLTKDVKQNAAEIYRVSSLVCLKKGYWGSENYAYMHLITN